jgi:4a-hydroxytetrahydrobiopterin dehydratase
LVIPFLGAHASSRARLTEKIDSDEKDFFISRACEDALQERRVPMKLSEEQIKENLSRLGDWRREGDWLVRDLKFENFKRAMEFVNRVADEAEAMDHHPDILIHGWNKVRLSIMTHSIGGLTEKDFKLAGRINGLI